jgi:uncharacterized protein YegP (UPF0339 family)
MTLKTLTINRNLTLSRSEDFNFLRRKGLEYIQRLGSAFWTDYNIHDPGITILEALCYALTDLGFRTTYDMKDILAGKMPVEVQSEDTFFRARDILTSNPLTQNDYRKCMIDVEGVKNAWLIIDEKPKPEINIDEKNSVLTNNDKYYFSNTIFETSIKQKFNDEIWNALIALKGCSYSERETLENVLQHQLADFENKNVITKEICDLVERYPSFFVQGIYNVVLELDTDPELGDLNVLCIKEEMHDTGLAFSFEVHFLPMLNSFYKKHIDPLLMESCELSNLVWDSQKQIFRADMKVHFTDKRTETLPMNIISFGKRTHTVQNEIEKAVSLKITSYYKIICRRIEKSLKIVSEVRRRLLAARNVCEDFTAMMTVDIEDIALCAEIEVDNIAEVETILAQIYYTCSEFISPRISFYTLEEMVEKGKYTEEIFSGPVLDHGFIDDEELSMAEFRTEIHTSDLINIIMDIPGVIGIKNIVLRSYYAGDILVSAEPWCLKIDSHRSVRLNMDKSKITFYKNFIPHHADKEETFALLNDLTSSQRKIHLEKNIYDFSVPCGVNKTIITNPSVQGVFPLNYGIGEEGVSTKETDLRKAQSLQLKAFLSLFDRILSDLFAQLAHVKELFSLNPQVQKTYFSQPLFNYPLSYKIEDTCIEDIRKKGIPEKVAVKLKNALTWQHYDVNTFCIELQKLLGSKDFSDYGSIILENSKIPAIEVQAIPGIEKIYKPFYDYCTSVCEKHIENENAETVKNLWNNYLLYDKGRMLTGYYAADMVLESVAEYEERKNRILDHLMARFCEQFTDYTLLMYKRNRKKAPSELIEDKQEFLREYPVISRDKARAVNYTTVSSENICGLKKRVSRLVGIEDCSNRKLFNRDRAFFDRYQETDKNQDLIEEYRFRLIGDDGKILLSSTKRYTSFDDLNNAIDLVIQLGRDEANYQIKENFNDRRREEKYQYSFLLNDKQGTTIARRVALFKSRELCKRAVTEVMNRIETICILREGFHVVEHILLRPREGTTLFLPVDTKKKCKCCLGFTDPYSFRITVVAPSWPDRFADLNFRNLFEKTVRLEAPAHIHVKVCWVSRDQMEQFENAYFIWQDRIANEKDCSITMVQAQDELVHRMSQLRNVYPVVHLHKCDNHDENIALINHSYLGSTPRD